MNYLVVIPARGGSKGIPGKNIKELGGKPLIHYTIESALEYFGIHEIWVNTEDKRICETVEMKGVQVFNRPEHLAQDSTPTIEVLIDMVKALKSKNLKFDAIVLLQATYPFRRKDFIRDSILKFESNNCDSLVSVRPVPHQYNPHWVFESNGSYLNISTGEKEIIPRRQDLPEAFHRDGAIYITSMDCLLNKGSLLGDRLGYIISDSEDYVNIDTMDDWKIAESILLNRKK